MSNYPETYLAGFHDETCMKQMKYNVFGGTGLKISALALGTGGFCNQYGDFDKDECKRTLEKALKSGVNYIDTAPWYGHGVSEETLGYCLKDIPRQTYYIATKVSRYERDPKLMFDFSAEKTRSSIDTSLKRLGLEYVDVLQIHDIEFAPSVDHVIQNTLPVLQEAVRAGKARFIGVTGYPISTLAEFVSKAPGALDMVLSYSRLTLVEDSLTKYLPTFEGLGIINAASLMLGLLTNGGPQPWHPAPQAIKDVCAEAASICKQHGVELAKLAMHHVHQLDGKHTELVGVNNVKLLESNLDVLFNGLDSKEKAVLLFLKTNIFSKINTYNWEGVEVKRYWENVKA